MARKSVKYCVADAFAESAFKGNPAAVCLLAADSRGDDQEWMQAVAREFNQPITCFLIRLSDSDGATGNGGATVPRFRIRWFTTVLEVKLCGHATLAASHFLFTHELSKFDTVELLAMFSGTLIAKRVHDTKNLEDDSFFIELNFPAFHVKEFEGFIDDSSISKSVSGARVVEVLSSAADTIFVLPSGEEVAKVEPDFDEIRKFPGRGIIITGIAPPGSRFDFISRFFSPIEGIDEDQVCGSAHCALATYWMKKLGKCDFIAYQASKRGGVLILYIDQENQRVLIRGKAVTVMEGSLLV